MDGAFNIKGSRVGIILEGPNGLTLEQPFHFNFKATNNQEEYKALIAWLNLVKEMGASRLIAKSNSQLVTNQVKGEFQTKELQLSRYLNKVRGLRLTHCRPSQYTSGGSITKILGRPHHPIPTRRDAPCRCRRGQETQKVSLLLYLTQELTV